MNDNNADKKQEATPEVKKEVKKEVKTNIVDLENIVICVSNQTELAFIGGLIINDYQVFVLSDSTLPKNELKFITKDEAQALLNLSIEKQKEILAGANGKRIPEPPKQPATPPTQPKV